LVGSGSIQSCPNGGNRGSQMPGPASEIGRQTDE